MRCLMICLGWTACCAGSVLLAPAALAQGSSPALLALHPDNPHYCLWRAAFENDIALKLTIR